MEEPDASYSRGAGVEAERAIVQGNSAEGVDGGRGGGLAGSVQAIEALAG